MCNLISLRTREEEEPKPVQAFQSFILREGRVPLPHNQVKSPRRAAVEKALSGCGCRAQDEGETRASLGSGQHWGESGLRHTDHSLHQGILAFLEAGPLWHHGIKSGRGFCTENQETRMSILSEMMRQNISNQYTPRSHLPVPQTM